MDMPHELPAWALETATPADRNRVLDAQRRDVVRISWPARGLRDWAKQQGWPTPRFGFEAAFTRTMLESDANFARALQDSGITVVLPVARYALPDEELAELDQLYAARSADGRPSSWGILVEALRGIRRAVEAGVEVVVEGQRLTQFGSFYAWAHGRYHMLEDGYDSWIGDDRS
jgi:hypothetical protein